MRYILSALILANFLNCAYGQSIKDIIEKRGFEFRANQEVPWGVKLQAPHRLIWVEANGAKYKIDPASPIVPNKEREFIQAYLGKYAKQEVALAAELFLRAPPNVDVMLGAPLISTSPTVLEEPPIVEYSAYFPDAAVAKKPKEIHCRFMFMSYKGSVFLVYSKRFEESAIERSVEPHCG